MEDMKLNNERQDGTEDDSSTIADGLMSSPNISNTTVVRSQLETNKIYHGNCLDVLKTFPDNCIDCCITSPPYYGLRDYGIDGQIGLEDTPELFVEKLVEVFAEIKRCLKTNGTLWLNIGDSYAGSGNSNGSAINPNTISYKAGHNIGNVSKSIRAKVDGYKAKDLIGIPWLLAFALRSNGWYLRQDIIWNKPNPMPESVTDRCTKAHEYIFLLTKSAKYFFDADAIKTKMECSLHDARARKSRKRFPTELVNGIRGNNPEKVYEWANKRSVWTVNTMPYKDAHFATFPERLITDCIKAGCPENGIVLDPFSGAGTTALVARKLHRNFVGIELNEKYIEIANKRLSKELGMFR